MHYIMLDQADKRNSIEENIKKHSFVESLHRKDMPYKVICIKDISITGNVLSFNGKQVSSTDIIWNQTSPSEPNFINIMMAASCAVSSSGGHVHFLNSPKSILTLNSKRIPDILNLNAPYPKLITCNEKEGILFGLKIINEGSSVVIKPIHGFGGKGVVITSDNKTLSDSVRKIIDNEGVCDIEKFIDSSDSRGDVSIDKRVYICDGKIIFHINRVNEIGKTCNFASGGWGEKSTLSEVHHIAINKFIYFMKKSNTFYACMDFIGDIVTEINLASPGGVTGYIKCNPSKNPVDEIIDLSKKLSLASLTKV